MMMVQSIFILMMKKLETFHFIYTQKPMVAKLFGQKMKSLSQVNVGAARQKSKK